jgi:hypothetical protein
VLESDIKAQVGVDLLTIPTENITNRVNKHCREYHDQEQQKTTSYSLYKPPTRRRKEHKIPPTTNNRTDRL